MKKKLLSLLLVCTLVLGMIPAAALADETESPFQDVKTTDWFFNAVQYVCDHNLMSGTGNNRFSPSETTTRGMMMTILHNMEGKPAAGSPAFTDVPAGEWYAAPVAWASAHGIVSGYGNGRFGPNDPITREQMVAILYQYARYKNYELTVTGDISTFDDYNETSAYAVTPFNWAIGKGLVAGVGDHLLDPTGNAERSHIAAIMKSFCEKVVFNKDEEEAGEATNPESPEDNPKPSVPVTKQTVTFLYNYEDLGTYKTISVKSGNEVAEPEKPVRSGHVFLGWFTSAEDGTEYQFDQAVTGDLTLYAHWEKESGEITYKAPTEDHIETGLFSSDGNSYEAKYVDNQLVVMAKSGIARETVEEMVAEQGGTIVGTIETVDLYQVEFPAEKTLEQLNELVEKWKNSPNVEDAYLNTVFETENQSTPYYPEDDWNIDSQNGNVWDELNPDGNNWGVEAINAPSAWQMLIDKYGSVSSVPTIRVGVIDAYVDQTHPDLQIEHNWMFTTKGNAFFEDPFSETYITELASEAKTWEDFSGVVHGTHVAGTISARFNGKGINGVALNCELYGASTEELFWKSGVYEETISSIYGKISVLSLLIEKSNCQVINYSMGFTEKPSDSYRHSAGEKVADVLGKYIQLGKDDFLIVAAAGNYPEQEAANSSIFTIITDEVVKSHIIVVGNAINDLPFRYYPQQCYGERIDVMAPGTDIYSTVSLNEQDLYNQRGEKIYSANQQFVFMTGTSMAAPHVTGLAALVWAANPDLKGNQVKDIIVQTANIPLWGVDAGGYSHSMVNAAYAVAKALGIDYVVEGTYGDQFSWTLDMTGHLTFSGGGDLDLVGSQSEYYVVPCSKYNTFIKEITLGDEILSVCQEAFIENTEVTKVNLGSGIKRIGEFAFGGMEHLKYVFIPQSVTQIGEWAFGYSTYNQKVEDFTISGYAGSAAEKYAKENGFRFVPVTSENAYYTLEDLNNGVSVQIGDFVTLGTYYEEPILWRCVDIDENGPLMLSDRIIGIKPFDASGASTGMNGNSSHSRGNQFYHKRTVRGSNFWADSNIRNWLNSTAQAGEVTYTCGNVPNDAGVYGGLNSYESESGFLSFDNFSDEELSYIRETTQKVAINEVDKAFASSGSKEHVYTDNIAECVQNYNTDAFTMQATDRMFFLNCVQLNAVYENFKDFGDQYWLAFPTEAAVEHSEYKSSDLSADKMWFYWLRDAMGDSPYPTHVRHVNPNGGVYFSWAHDDLHIGIRPAFYLKLGEE